MAKTIFEHRLIAALVLCLSGLALLPFDLLPRRVFGWEQLAEAYELIFWDDFEVGSEKRWQVQAPENLRFFPTTETDSFDRQYRLDKDLLTQYSAEGLVLMAGFSAAGDPMFSVEGRVTDLGLEMRLGAAVDGGEWQYAEWLAVDPDSRLGIEWQRGHAQAEDGSLYLSVDDRLSSWLTDLDNDSLRLEMLALTKFGIQTLLLPLQAAF